MLKYAAESVTGSGELHRNAGRKRKPSILQGLDAKDWNLLMSPLLLYTGFCDTWKAAVQAKRPDLQDVKLSSTSR